MDTNTNNLPCCTQGCSSISIAGIPIPISAIILMSLILFIIITTVIIFVLHELDEREKIKIPWNNWHDANKNFLWGKSDSSKVQKIFVIKITCEGETWFCFENFIQIKDIKWNYHIKCTSIFEVFLSRLLKNVIINRIVINFSIWKDCTET